MPSIFVSFCSLVFSLMEFGRAFLLLGARKSQNSIPRRDAESLVIGLLEEHMDGWMDGRMNEWTDGLLSFFGIHITWDGRKLHEDGKDDS
jgi:hypothetical protein